MSKSVVFKKCTFFILFGVFWGKVGYFCKKSGQNCVKITGDKRAAI